MTSLAITAVVMDWTGEAAKNKVEAQYRVGRSDQAGSEPSVQAETMNGNH